MILDPLVILLLFLFTLINMEVLLRLQDAALPACLRSSVRLKSRVALYGSFFLLECTHFSDDVRGTITLEEHLSLLLSIEQPVDTLEQNTKPFTCTLSHIFAHSLRRSNTFDQWDEQQRELCQLLDRNSLDK